MAGYLRNCSLRPSRDEGFSSPKHPDWVWVTPYVVFSGYQDLFPPSPVAKVKNVWPYTSASPYTFVACTGKLHFIFLNFKIMCIINRITGIVAVTGHVKGIKYNKFRYSECMQNTLQHQTLCGSD